MVAWWWLPVALVAGGSIGFMVGCLLCVRHYDEVNRLRGLLSAAGLDPDAECARPGDTAPRPLVIERARLASDRCARC